MSAESNRHPDSPLSILVVDDDDLNQRMMRLILKREGHLVESAANGAEAVEAVKSGRYDMVLMDLQMPVMDGVEASRRIREWENGNGHMFIVALTASYLPEKGRELFDAGIDNYMAKPFEVEHLRHILQYGLESRKSRQAAVTGFRTVEAPVEDQELNPGLGLQRVGGDVETYREFLRDFLDDLPAKLESLWSNYKNQDVEGLQRAAHNLKGVSASLGALQLSECARRLEKQVSQGYTESTEVLIQDVSSAMRKFKVVAAGYLSGGEAKAAEIS